MSSTTLSPVSKPIVYLAGYSGQRVATLVSRARELNALVVDVRYTPYSQQTGWNGWQLAEELGGNYIQARAWGNEARGSGRIVITDWERGYTLVQQALERAEFDALILLCACRAESQCHRTVLGKNLWQLGYTVRPLVWHPAEEPMRPQMAMEMT